MNKQVSFVEVFRRLLPSPFSIAIILTILAIFLALFFTSPAQDGGVYIIDILQYWKQGFWELLAFSMQMVLILVLGHTLALTKPFQLLIDKLTNHTTSTASAAAIVSFTAIFIGLLNWGLCLIFGAILARKVAERAKAKNIGINYPLVAAAGYSGLMVWHGGFSGSAPLTVAEESHFLSEKIGRIPVEFTILSNMNITISITLLIVIPLVLYFVGKKQKPTPLPAFSTEEVKNKDSSFDAKGAEYLDFSPWLAIISGLTIVLLAIYQAMQEGGDNPLGILELNYINFLLFGLSLVLHGSVANFLDAVNDAIAGAAGIVIQFPLYAGIMGIMKYSGLVLVFSNAVVDIANSDTLPIFTFLSAGLVNLFVPSGGGQWAVQGPIIAEAAQALNSPLNTTIMALAYGDGLTNMLQPFWALPLLGITKLDAKDILPYSSIIMLLGIIIYLTFLWLF